MAESDQTQQSSEQDLSEGRLEDLETDELQPVIDPPSRLAGYNQSQHLEPDSSDELDHGSDNLPRPEIARGGNQTEAIDRQNQLEQAARASDEKTKTAN